MSNEKKELVMQSKPTRDKYIVGAELDADGEVFISIDSIGEAAYINKGNYIRMRKHLDEVFGLDK